jgi:hypothetical protein
VKRVAVLAIIIFACMAGYFAAQGVLPLVPVRGPEMAPALPAGSLLLVRPAADIKEGDIVVTRVATPFRRSYNYPPVIAHRVSAITQDATGTWLTLKGDNTGEDPFTVRLRDVRVISGRVPFLGFPLLFFQSRVFMQQAIAFIVLLALYLFLPEIVFIFRKSFRALVSPAVEESERAGLNLSHRFENTEKALESFSSAMLVYAEHLASHTSAIQGLSEASQSLKVSAAEQNVILGRMTEALTRQRSRVELSRIQGVVDSFERKTREILEARDALEKGLPAPPAGTRPVIETRQEPQPKTPEEPVARPAVSAPRGCAVKPRAFQVRPHYSSN